MPWWGWVLSWIALTVIGAAYVAWRLWRLWSPLKALGREVADVQDRLSEIEARVRDLESELRDVDDLAVLQHPAVLRQQRNDLRRRTREERVARRHAHRPAWVDHVD